MKKLLSVTFSVFLLLCCGSLIAAPEKKVPGVVVALHATGKDYKLTITEVRKKGKSPFCTIEKQSVIGDGFEERYCVVMNDNDNMLYVRLKGDTPRACIIQIIYTGKNMTTLSFSPDKCAKASIKKMGNTTLLTLSAGKA